jgi:hypothetical protein
MQESNKDIACMQGYDVIDQLNQYALQRGPGRPTNLLN